jgi:hypothetical protein
MTKRRPSRRRVRKPTRKLLPSKISALRRKAPPKVLAADFRAFAFGCFSEWSSEADEKAYRNLQKSLTALILRSARRARLEGRGRPILRDALLRNAPQGCDYIVVIVTA